MRPEDASRETNMTTNQKGSRRIRLSPDEIEAIIAAGQRRGLNTTSVSHYPDGRFEIHFGGGHEVTSKEEITGWEDF
jgi:hypothetical protein